MATLKDVAIKAGLTVGTVSRVLNNRGYISQQAREKVYEAMRELNYQPNKIAQSLSQKKSNTIGVIVPDISYPYFAKAVYYLTQLVYDHNYELLLFSGNGEREEEFIKLCESNRVAGMISFSNLSCLKKFEHLEFPLVTIENYYNSSHTEIECDNYYGGALAAEHLIGKGCTHLFYLATDNVMDKKRQGFENTCIKHEGVSYEFYNFGTTYDNMNYFPIINAILKEHPETDGIFAGTDIIAAQVIQVCGALGYNVPGRLKVIGFEDTDIATLTTPKITTIHQPLKEMVEEAVSLIERKRGGGVVPARSVFSAVLVEREST